MLTKKNIPVLLATTLLCSFLLIGCKPDTPEPIVAEEETTTTEAETSMPAETESEVATPETTETPETTFEDITDVSSTKTISITYYNLSNVNIGMLSVIVPTTQEQLNLNRLDSNTSLSFECNWPSNTSELYWALYDESGQLFLEAKTDVSTATKSATLILTGEDSIEDVEVTLE